MKDNNITEVMNSILKGADAVLTTKTIVGEPQIIGDITLIPLVEVSFGLAAGANAGEKKNSGSGGMGGKMTPSAILLIQDGHTKLINVKNQDMMTKVLDMIPDLVDRIAEFKEKKNVETEIDSEVCKETDDEE